MSLALSPVISLGSVARAAKAFVTSFNAPLISSLVPASAWGSASPTFTRADATACATHTDFEGVVRVVPANCARFMGARLVRNLLTFTEDFSNVAWNKTVITAAIGNTVTFSASTLSRIEETAAGNQVGKTLRFSVDLSGTPGEQVNIALVDNGGAFASSSVSVTLSATPIRYSITRTGTADASSGLLARIQNGVTATVKVVVASRPMTEDVTGQTNQNPSEYVPVGMGGPLYGSELVTAAASWSPSSGVTVNTGASSITFTGTQADYVTVGVVTATSIIGKSYVLTFTLSSVTGAGVKLYFGGVDSGYKTVAGTYSVVVTAVSASIGFVQCSSAGVTGVVSNISGAGVDGIQFFDYLNPMVVA
jgi:hypothetical protein